jgi:23S rRNA pseudouridine1911/1915/1917 synthase
MKIPIIFEDNHIIVVEKPVNIPSQQDESNDRDMLTLIKREIKERYNKPGNVYLGLVHRLDRPTGGIMVFAKTSKAASRLSEEIRAGRFRKAYLSVAHGLFEKPESELTHYLIKDKKTNTVSVTGVKNKGSKQALLYYKVIEYIKGLSLVKINLVTGRPHQIRVQFSNEGHPLWGDQKYGEELTQPGEQLALWSSEIGFNHPVTKKELLFTSMPPTKNPWTLFTSLRQSLS